MSCCLFASARSNYVRTFNVDSIAAFRVTTSWAYYHPLNARPLVSPYERKSMDIYIATRIIKTSKNQSLKLQRYVSSCLRYLNNNIWIYYVFCFVNRNYLRNAIKHIAYKVFIFFRNILEPINIGFLSQYNKFFFANFIIVLL